MQTDSPIVILKPRTEAENLGRSKKERHTLLVLSTQKLSWRLQLEMGSEMGSEMGPGESANSLAKLMN